MSYSKIKSEQINNYVFLLYLSIHIFNFIYIFYVNCKKIQIDNFVLLENKKSNINKIINLRNQSKCGQINNCHTEKKGRQIDNIMSYPKLKK